MCSLRQRTKNQRFKKQNYYSSEVQYLQIVYVLITRKPAKNCTVWKDRREGEKNKRNLKMKTVRLVNTIRL
jgi:hypothetical protein